MNILESKTVLLQLEGQGRHPQMMLEQQDRAGDKMLKTSSTSSEFYYQSSDRETIYREIMLNQELHHPFQNQEKFSQQAGNKQAEDVEDVRDRTSCYAEFVSVFKSERRINVTLASENVPFYLRNHNTVEPMSESVHINI